jgi:hypothetical protein
VLRPREARVVTTVLGASAVNDVAQASFTWLCAKATAQERAVGGPVAGGVGDRAFGARPERGRESGPERFAR